MSATGFLDACGFFPAAGGTADFVVSSAVTGYQTPASAGAANGAVYSYRAQSSNMSEWEIGFGAYATGTTTLARTTIVASSTGSKVNFSAPPSVYVTALTADLDDPWRQQPVGVPIPILDSITGVAQPPTGNPYRYIKLTASDSYNTGVLTSESVTGSAPLVVATAVISLAGSPINGQTVNLVNTEELFERMNMEPTTYQKESDLAGMVEFIYQKLIEDKRYVKDTQVLTANEFKKQIQLQEEMQKNGIQCYAFEVSPFMHLLSSVKMQKNYNIVNS